MLNLTGNSTQGHWRMRPQTAPTGRRWRRRLLAKLMMTMTMLVNRNGNAGGEDVAKRSEGRLSLCFVLFCFGYLLWHKFQLLAFNNNLKQIKFCAVVDYCLLIGVCLCMCVCAHAIERHLLPVSNIACHVHIK